MIESLVRFATRALPEAAANPLTRALASITQRPAISATQKSAMARATMLRYGEGNKHVAWAWGSGPLVVFVHGWGGRAAQLAPLADQVASLGFRCVAIEVTGHGDSPKYYTRWAFFQRDLADLVKSLRQDVYAYVGHSAGGLSMMAARKLVGLRAQKYVCIAAPSHPFPPIEVLKKRLNPPAGVVEDYKRYIAQQFKSTWNELQTGTAYDNAGPDTLLIYDEQDRFVNHSEGDKLLARCPGSQLIKTQKRGHSGVVSAPEVLEAVSGFLRRDMRAAS